MNDDQQLMRVEPGLMHKLATDVAGACKEIVEATAIKIQNRMYVKVEGWQAIANGFGCTAGARDVEKIYDEASGEFLGFKAIGEVKRQRDGAILATAEGFVGCDEPRWFGGEMETWDNAKRKMVTKRYAPAPEYAARAMAQTRAISRACRSAFAFVVVLINREMSTTPAEEMEPGDEPHGAERETRAADAPQAPANGRWQDVVCSYGTKNGPLRGKKLGELTTANRKFLYEKFVTNPEAKPYAELTMLDKALVDGLKQWADEGWDETK